MSVRLWSCRLGSIPTRVKSITLKLVFTASLLDKDRDVKTVISSSMLQALELVKLSFLLSQVEAELIKQI